MTALDSFLAQGWQDHARNPEAVAGRLRDAIPLVQNDGGLSRLSMLAHHVYGEHLRRWEDGLKYLEALSALEIEGAEGAATLARCRMSLRLCGGQADDRASLSASERCRVTIMAACNLAAFDPKQASIHLEDAALEAAALAAGDAAVRSVAAFANNIAGTLQEVQPLDDARRRLMLRAAEVARRQWERAGTWREVERAEYRLAVCWLVAGEPMRGLQHAQLCDDIVRENGSEPLEAFFAAEAVALAARELGRAELQAEALTAAQSSFRELSADDQAWCRATLEKLGVQ